MANITWNITQLECKTKQGDLENVVTEAHWVCSGFNFDLEGSRYESYMYGSIPLPTPNPEDFIPYADLTKDEVLNWIWVNGVDKAATELNITNQINDQIGPIVVKPPLPWENTVEPQPESQSDPQPETGDTNG